MSYILDALKKIEHEKNKKAQPDGRISISGDLFQERKRPAARAGIWKIVMLIVVASLLTFTGTWFLLQGNDKKNTADTRPAEVPTTATVQSPALFSPTPAPMPVEPLPVPVPVALMPAVPSAADRAIPKREEVVAGGESSARSVRSPLKKVKVQSLSTIQPAQTVPAPAGIMLSGIAWQESRAARRAVVNGFLFKEGAVVAGAKITNIKADRVRFLSSAGTFEIKLDSVLPAEVKQ
jgi:general secretion pathway protein B